MPHVAPWAEGCGVVLLPIGADAPLTPGLLAALADGIERGYVGDLPPRSAAHRWYLIEAADGECGVLALRRGWPRAGAATVTAIAIDRAHRGRGYGTRALLAAEQRLAADGVEAVFARVPRTNGRGFYFMLRAGYALAGDPLPGTADGDEDHAPRVPATWFMAAPRAATGDC